MKTFKAVRKHIEFTYEFMDGTSAKVKYLEPTTQQIDESIDIEDAKERLSFLKNTLTQCLRSDTDGAVDKIVAEQTTDGNIYEFKSVLDEELGKLKKNA